MGMETLITFITLILSFLTLFGCGQQIINDDGLDTKDIDSAGSANVFRVVSVNPVDGATNVDRDINISFTFNKSLSSVGAGSGNCGSQLFYLSTDSNFGSCQGYATTCGYSSTHYEISNNGKTVTLCLNQLNNNHKHYIKVVSTSTTTTLEAIDGSPFTEFNSSFTTGN